MYIHIYTNVYLYMVANHNQARRVYTYIHITATDCIMLQQCCNSMQHYHSTAAPYSNQITATRARALCNTLHYTAKRCNISQHAATHCNSLQLTVIQYNLLQHFSPEGKTVTVQQSHTQLSTIQQPISHCNRGQHTATHCNTLQHTATHCNKLQKYRRTAAPYSTLSHFMTL